MAKVLVVIPARGGSKRVPGKNKRFLGGQPLVSWTIQTATSALDAKVVVSTDSADIADIARKYDGIDVFMRSPQYATDEASVIDVILEVLNYYEGKGVYFESTLLLQPTSPFRTIESIQEAIALYERSNGESIVSVSPAATHPYWCKKVEHGNLLPFDDKFDANIRSQDLPPVYQLNGSIYLSSVKNIKENKSLYSKKTKAFIIDNEEEAVDIDTPFDWLIAEAIANRWSDKK